MTFGSGHRLPSVVNAKHVAACRTTLPAPEVLSDAVDVFRVLASPVRLRIVHALTHRELSVGDLARAMDLSLSNASHQLSVLRRMKLVSSRDVGRVTFYRAIDDFVGHLVHDCLAHAGGKLGLAVTPHHQTHRLPRPRARRRGRVPLRGESRR